MLLDGVFGSCCGGKSEGKPPLAPNSLWEDCQIQPLLVKKEDGETLSGYCPENFRRKTPKVNYYKPPGLSPRGTS